MSGRNDPCWCGSGIKWKKCHYPHKAAEDFFSRSLRYYKEYKIILKTPEQIQGIRSACQIAAKILKELCLAAQKGVTTNALNQLSLELHRKYGATPAPLGYGDPPFPKSICTSLNDIICHGIANDRPLQEGDIMNIDVTAILNGFYGDCSAMVMIGEVSAEKKLVVQVAHEGMMQAISILKPGLPIYEIGKTIETYAKAHKCSVVDQFVSHGVGVAFHENPQIPHYLNHVATPLTAGMTFTIEPMINAGTHRAVIDVADGWTARTADGKPSAQWEHTVLITETGHEILTIA